MTTGTITVYGLSSNVDPSSVRPTRSQPRLTSSSGRCEITRISFFVVLVVLRIQSRGISSLSLDFGCLIARRVRNLLRERDPERPSDDDNCAEERPRVRQSLVPDPFEDHRKDQVSVYKGERDLALVHRTGEEGGRTGEC